MQEYLEILQKIVKKGIVLEGALRGCHFRSILTYSRCAGETWETFIASVLNEVTGINNLDFGGDKPTSLPRYDDEVLETLYHIDPSITGKDLDFILC